MDRHQLVAALAAMTEDEYDAVTTEARHHGAELTPMETASTALRRSRGLDRITKPASREQAAAALARYRGSI